MLSQQPNESSDAFAPLYESLSTEAIQKIKQDLIQNPETASSQLTKYNISIGNESQISIGDTYSQYLDENSREVLISAIQEANKLTNGKIFQNLQEFPFEPLNINIQTINKLNSDLGAVSTLANQGLLTDTQKITFSEIKRKVHSLGDFNKELEELELAARGLIEETRLSLKQRIEELNKQGEELLDFQALEAVAKEQECKTKELKILEEFIMELDDSRKIAKWLNSTREVLAKRFGREALRYFPDIEEKSEPEKLSCFCFSINQFLEQIAHCLTWGRYDILDSPGIPLIFNCPVYEKAFLLIREMIDQNLPSRFSRASRDLACQCIDYLIFQLPSYEKEHDFGDEC